MECRTVQEPDSRWDRFVVAQPAGTFFHLWAWREVLKNNFGYEATYLAVEESGELEGILPLFLVKSLIFGRSLVSMPLGVYGGALARTERAKLRLLEEAKKLADSHRARYLEIRGNPYAALPDTAPSESGYEDWARNDLYVTFIGDIDPNDDVNFSRIPRKQRRMIRQGQKNGLRAVFDNSRLNEFYQIYAESVRNLGTPVYAYDYFQSLLKVFGNACEVLLIEHRGEAIAGVLVFLYKDQVMPYYGGALKKYLHLAPNDFMYWELMSYGAANGFKIFDFGRSKEGTGSYSFKRHWGFEPRPLPYWRHAFDGHRLPDTSPLNPKFQWAIRIWRSMPLKLTMALGPHIVRHIP